MKKNKKLIIKILFFSIARKQMFQAKSFFFHIHYQAHFDQQIIIVGDCVQFGNWDINKGIKLEWNQVKTIHKFIHLTKEFFYFKGKFLDETI